MKRHDDQIDRTRREFVSGAATAGLTGMLASAVPATAMADSVDEAENVKGDRGYRLTQHVLDYYKSATS